MTIRASARRTDAVTVLRDHFSGSDDICVASNCNVYWREGVPTAVVEPDLMVITDVAAERLDEVASYRTWQHGGLPVFVLEVLEYESVLAEMTYLREAEYLREDLDYKRGGTPPSAYRLAEYWRVDPTGGRTPPRGLQGETPARRPLGTITVTVNDAGLAAAKRGPRPRHRLARPANCSSTPRQQPTTPQPRPRKRRPPSRRDRPPGRRNRPRAAETALRTAETAHHDGTTGPPRRTEARQAAEAGAAPNARTTHRTESAAGSRGRGGGAGSRERPAARTAAAAAHRNVVGVSPAALEPLLRWR